MRAMRVTALAVASLCVSSHAGAEPVFLMHAILSDFSSCESIETPALRCNDLSVSPGSNDDYFAWVLIGDVGGEITGAQFGISYDSSVNVATWVGCAGQQIPYGSWPGSGSGVAMTMRGGGCHLTPANDMVKLGFFYVTSGSSGKMRIADYPGPDAGAMITDCNHATERACEYNGRLAFGGVGGYVPAGCRCSGPPAVEASWSGIKSEFRDP